MTDDHRYLLDNQQAQAKVRFDALSTIFDPWTFRHIDDFGIGPGWRCWEIGAGAMSVPAWLAARVGPTGRVLATDIDVSWMNGDSDGRVEVKRHDVAHDPPPAEGFDLVHARLVLVHLVDREKALRSMVDSLRPGGVVFVEDADPALLPLICPDEHGPEQRLANKLRNAFRELLAQRGGDLRFGRKLPRLLRQAGLVDVQADAFFPVTTPACNRLEAATVEQVRERLVAAGLATDDEIAQHLENVRSGGLDLATAPLISAWGRSPRAREHGAGPE